MGGKPHAIHGRWATVMARTSLETLHVEVQCRSQSTTATWQRKRNGTTGNVLATILDGSCVSKNPCICRTIYSGPSCVTRRQHSLIQPRKKKPKELPYQTKYRTMERYTLAAILLEKRNTSSSPKTNWICNHAVEDDFAIQIFIFYFLWSGRGDNVNRAWCPFFYTPLFLFVISQSFFS